MALINPLLGSNLASTGFDTTLIGNSAWFDGSADYLTRTPGSAGNRTRWTIAWWFQLNAISTEMVFFSANNGTNEFRIGLESAGQMMVQDDNASMNMQTAMLFRDIAWYHCIVSYDSNQAEADRVKVFVNGVDQTLNAVSAGTPSSAGQTFWNDARANEIGRRSRTTSVYANAYMAQILFLDGDSIQNSDVAVDDILDSATFGENGSQRIPKANETIAALATSAGGNSFCLDFADASNFGNDISGNSPSGENDFTVNSMGSVNQSLNTPSKVYATWNALDSALDGHHTDMSLSEGNTVTQNGNGAFCRSTFAIPEGLFSYRVTVDDSTSNQMFGVALNTATDRANGNTNHPNMYAVNAGNGAKNTNGTGSSQYSAWSDGDTMEVYVSRSATTYKVWYGKNGTLLNGASGSQGDPSAGTNELFSFTHTGDVFFSVDYTNPGTKKATTDFGQRGYTPAEEALTLSSPNIPAPTHQGCDAFSAVTYTGDGVAAASGGKAVTNVGFSPSWVWIKNRDASDSHALYDVVRGTTKQIETDTTAIETTEAEGLSVFGSDGFTVGSLAEVNTNTEDYVSWNWKAGASASSNGTGSITSAVSAALPGHFSIVGYNGNSTNGATVGHSLGGAPELIIFRGRGGSGASSFLWRVFSTVGGAGKYLRLNDTTALQNDTGYLNNTLPNETVFTLGTDGDVNNSNYNYVALCFRSIKGVCKIGTYEANNNADGPYISTGFRVAMTITKPIDVSGAWMILDNAREPTNPVQKRLFPDSNGAEDIDGDQMDFYADGFKLRKSGGHNGSGTYLYVAFADIASGAGLAPIYGR